MEEISWKQIAIIAIIGTLLVTVYLYTSISSNHNTPEGYIDNVSITNSSDGLWNINLNTATLANLDYFGVEIMWVDSSNRIIMRELVYNQTHVTKGQVFNISQSFNLSETPSEVDILFFDNPYYISDINNAHMQYIFKYDNGTWINANFQKNDTHARDLFKNDKGT